MEKIRNFYSNFLNNNFSDVTNRRIKPEVWNTRTLILNLKLSAIIAVIVLIIVFVTLLIVLNGVFGMGISFLSLLGISTVISVVYSYKKFNGYVIIPDGNFGMIKIQNNIRGSMDNNDKWILEPGDYRKVIQLPAFPKTFDALNVKMRAKSGQSSYFDVKDKNGVAWHGDHSYLIFISNPWVFVRLILSIGFVEAMKIIEEISLEAINTSFDEKTTIELMGDDGSNALLGNYREVLRDDDNCSEAKADFYSGIIPHGKGVFYIEEVGVTVRFLIKTAIPPEKIQDAYTALESAEKEGDAKVILQGKKDLAVSIALEAVRKFYEDSGKLDEFNIAKAKEDIMIQMNEFTNENIFQVSGTNGPLGPLETIVATMLNKSK